MDFIGQIINNKYEVKYKIGEGGMSTVWLAENIYDKKNVAIKILKKYAISRRIENIIRFKNEATTVSQLNVSSIVKIFELGEVNNITYIVMEYLEGSSLQTIIDNKVKLKINVILEIILQLAEALKYIHNANIIHRDLKPGNIIITNLKNKDVSNVEVKLIDFGLSQVKEYKMACTEGFVGTLVYMSPEQSGISKKNVDERSDLYSLGIIFYQLLTRILPFNGDNINSILHQQIAKIPELPSKINSYIPNIINKIVLKLLEKEPEKRYQSAVGLINDLEKFKKEKKDFVLGLNDKYIKLSYRTNLVGRYNELKKLKLLYDEASNGNGRFCLIAGETGQGKTRLVEEIREYVYEKNGIYINTKCFSEKNKIPYGPFKDAINEYIKSFHLYSDEQKKIIRDFFNLTLGELGSIILKLNPSMAEILSNCPPLIELEPDKENRRFLMVITQFIYSLSHVENALVLVIDDIHWLDESSIELLNHMIKEVSKHPILIISTYRYNEVSISQNQGLKYLVENSQKNNYSVFKILLQPLNLKNMNKLISGLLFNKISASREITNFIYQKCKGNPYFAIEILKQLINENVLVRDNDKWNFIKDALKKIEVPYSIVDVLIKNILLLNEKEIKILSYASVIGRTFNIEILLALSENSKEEIVSIIDNVIKLQFIEEVDSQSGKMMFSHDRLKEVFYKNIDEVTKKELHFKIATIIEQMKRNNNSNKDLFNLAYHYLEAANKDKILEYAYPAAIKYKEIYANDEALRYLIINKYFLEEISLKGSKMWIIVMESIGDTYLIIGKYDEAIEIFDEILPFINTTLRKANTYKQISRACYKKGDWRNCELYAKQGLKLLQERLPTKRSIVIFSIVKEFIIRIFITIFPFVFCSKNNSNEKIKQIIEFHHILAWLYKLNDINKCSHTTIRMFNLAERKLKYTKEYALSLGVYASFFLTRLGLFNMAISYHERNIALKRELNDEWGIAQSLQLIGFSYEWNGDYEKGIELYKQSIEIFKKIGDIGEVARTKNGLSSIYYNLADYKNAKFINDECFEIASRSKDVYGVLNSWEKAVQCYIEEGEYEKAEKIGIRAYELANDTENILDKCIMCALLGILSLEKMNIRKAIDYLEKAKETYENGSFMKQHTVFLYCYLAESYILEYSVRKCCLTKREGKILLNKIKKTCRTALRKTNTIITYHVTAMRVMAKYYFLIKKYKLAERCFLKSIGLSKKLNRKMELGKGLFEYGVFLEKQERSEESKRSLEAAYNLFKEIGSKVYEKKIGDLLGIVENESNITENFAKEFRYNQRLSSIITLSQDISSILDLNELLQKIMSVALEVTGSQKGYIIIQDEKDKELKVIARKSINQNGMELDDFSKHIVEQVLKSGKAVLSINAMEDEKYHAYESVLYNELKSILSIPIQYNKEIKGVCYLSNPLSSGVFTEEDMDILNVIMTQAAISIENAKLYKLAITDGLTELISHKHFKFMLNRQIECSKKANKVFSIIMFDIDYFKKFNDTHGHQAGDEILINVSRIVRDEFRSLDIIARYGGEEFAMILPETDHTGAETAADRLRKIVEDTVIYFRGKELRITISMGISVYPYHGVSIEELIKATDEAMYLSKRNGRNRISVAEYKN